MKIPSFLKAVSLAAAVAVSFAALTPEALAHNCKGSGTITIKQGSKPGEYWYFQNGKVCGRLVT